MTIFRRFPLRKLPVYLAAQTLGAFFGSLVIYGAYSQAINVFEGGARTVPGTASLFIPFPMDYTNDGEFVLFTSESSF